jgi:DNA-binding response OmpR family regulator
MTLLSPKSVLILEDEGLVGLMIEQLVQDMGAGMIDVFSAAKEALAALTEKTYDCAVLDVLVRDGTSMPVADALDERGIPFLFSSAVGAEVLHPRHRERPLLAKPFDDDTLKAQILSLIGAGGSFSPA